MLFLVFFRCSTSELSTLHFVFFYENLTKLSQHESNSGFFLSRSHIGRDSGFSSKIRIIPTKSGRLDNLHKLISGLRQLPSYVRQNTSVSIYKAIIEPHKEDFID